MARDSHQQYHREEVSGRFVSAPPLEHPWVDDSSAPLYVITYPDEVSDEELLARHQEILEWYAAADQPIAWVVDCTNVLRSPASQRRLIADHLDEIRPHAERICVAVGIVIDNTIVRGLLTAIFWLAPPPFRHSIFRSRANARAWVEAELARADVPSQTGTAP